MAKRTVIAAEDPPPKLVIPRDQAREKLTEQLEKGKTIQAIQIQSEEQLDEAWKQEKKWIDYVSEMLVRYFDNGSVKHDFATSYGSMVMAMNFYERVENFTHDINAKLTSLESIIERLEIIPETSTNNATHDVPQKSININEVFIVHGHDELIKTKVARFVESVGLTPIILHEQANGGRTLIEKLEHYSAVGFAIVLATPDDMGFPKGEEEKIQPRARQNVIAELGYFVGKLSRKNVSLLYSQGVELPTDFLGVVYIPIDDADGWKFTLAREMKSVGMPVDLNGAL